MRQDGRHRQIQSLAGGQWTVVRADQLRDLGLSHAAISRLSQTGVLHRRYKGIYTYGTDRPPTNGALLAAQWSCGEDAYLSADTGLALERLRGVFLGEISVAVPRRTVRARKGSIELIRTNRPPARLRTDGPLRWAPIPEALLDLSAQGASLATLKNRITEAIHLGRLRHEAMRALLADRAGAVGIVNLTRAYHRYLPDPEATHRFERAFDIGLATRPWLPQPLANVYLEAGGVRWELDRYFPDQKLLVELHGGAYHDADEDLDKDTFKAVKLALVGIEILAITDTRWEHEREKCLDDLEQMLTLRGWRRPD